MTRYAIDAGVALRLIREGSDADRRQQLEGLAAVKIRLLGDRVPRATAWKIAAGLGWEDIAMAEYLAVASLQADALVTDDDDLTSSAAGIVLVASYQDLSK